MANVKTKPAAGSVHILKVYDKVATHSPEIRLIGKWLQHCGFRAGQHIKVTAGPGKLTITHNEPDDKDA